MTKLKIMPHAVGTFLKGVGVENVELDANNHLIVHLDNEETVDAGEFKVDDEVTSGSNRPVAGGTLYQALASKVEKVEGKGLSANDFTDEDKTNVEKEFQGHFPAIESGYLSSASIGAVLPNKIESASYVCALHPVIAGTVIEYAGVGTAGAAQLVFTLDANKKIVRNASSMGIGTNVATPQTLTIEDGEYYVGYNSTTVSFNSYGVFRIVDGIKDVIKNTSEAITSTRENVGFYNCVSASNVVEKTINLPNFNLSDKCLLKVRFPYANTADNVTLNINGTGAKPLYFNGAQVSSANSWIAGEICLLYYNSQSARYELDTQCLRTDERGTSYQKVISQYGVELIVNYLLSKSTHNTCNSNASIAVKSVVVSSHAKNDGYGLMAVTFTNANTADNVTIQLGGNTTAAPFHYYGKRVSATNTWDAGDTLLLWYDNEKGLVDSINLTLYKYSSDSIIIPSWIEGKYLYSNGLPSGSSANYACTDFIEVQPMRTISIENAFTTDYSSVHFYDNTKTHIGRLESEAQTAVFTGQVDIPTGCRYIRYSIRVVQTNTNKIAYADKKTQDYLVNNLVNGWFADSFQKIGKLFKSAADRPILTIIDDDTPSSEGINRLVGLCDELGVKCTFATLTRQFELHPEMPDTIKALERRGYHFVIHGYSQHPKYQDADNNVAICEDDLVRGLQDMHQAGAMDFKYWVTPFGAQSDTMKRLAKKWGMNCMITTKEGIETTKAEQGKWAITRCGLNRTDAESDITLEGLKGLVDECVSINGWILLCTHIANGWSDNNYSRFKDIVNYARNAGCDIMPLNEAWNKRKPIYDFYENF